MIVCFYGSDKCFSRNEWKRNEWMEDVFEVVVTGADCAAQQYNELLSIKLVITLFTTI